MKKRSAKKVKRNKRNNNHLKTILFFILGIVAVIGTVYFITNQMVETRSRAQTTKGWLSGASGISKSWQDFGTWRGSPVTIAGVWSDATAEDQENQWAYIDYKDFPENLDLSVGAIYGSETFADIASGKLDTRLKKTLSLVDANWGNKKTIFLRFAHEFNGNWYKWSVTGSNVEDYKKAFQHFHGLVQSELVAKGRNAKVVWSPNDGNHSDIAIEKMWPGDQYVDVIGVDSYDWDPTRTPENWDSMATSTRSDGSPHGIEAWRKYAESKGKPMSFPEWGSNPKTVTDNPFYIQKMNEFFRKNAGTGPGQVWYEIYFNEWDPSKIGASSNIPQVASMYKSLKWGDGGIATNPSGTTLSGVPSAPSLITPSFVCGGSQECVPSSSPGPSNYLPGPSTYYENEQPDPSGAVNNPSGTPDDNGNDGEENNNDNGEKGNYNDKGRHGNGGGSGLFDLLLELFKKLIEFIMRLFGR